MRIHMTSRTAALSLVLAAMLVLSLSAAAFAAPQQPNFCTSGNFQWQCTDGSELYTVAPEPPISGQNGNGFFAARHFHGAGSYANEHVMLGPGMAMRFVTTQPYGGWWDASGNLNVVSNVNGTLTIPSSAVIVSVPGDILGNFDLPGWVKGRITDTGEFALGRVR